MSHLHPTERPAPPGPDPGRTDLLVRRSARLAVDDIDFGAFAACPLDADALRCLRYMHDVESHTICYLRDLLVTAAHRDPHVTAFLACWSYEEHWHGDAIGRVLAAHGEAAGTSRAAALRLTLPRRDRLRPLLFSLGSALSPHVVAVHMAWGAVNEWTTQAGYGRLAARAGHPVLAELLRRIMKQEGRHIDFYTAEACRRLDASAGARRLCRVALQRAWGPVGSGIMPAQEVAIVARYLFGGDAGRAAACRVDRQIDRMSGLQGLHLVERAVGAASRRARSRPVPAAGLSDRASGRASRNRAMAASS